MGRSHQQMERSQVIVTMKCVIPLSAHPIVVVGCHFPRSRSGANWILSAIVVSILNYMLGIYLIVWVYSRAV